VARLLQGGTQDSTDAAGADDADVEPCGSLRRPSQVTHAGNASASLRHVTFAP